MTGVRRIERAALALERTPLGALGRRAGLWRGALVLNYHRIGTPGATSFDRELWSATEEALDAQMGILARDFDVVGPDDLDERPAARGRRVLVTFDDGYRDNHELALPILRNHGLTATFFVVPGFVDRPRVPWWDEIAWIVDHAGPAPIELPEHGLAALAVRSDSDRRASQAMLLDVFKRLPGTRTGPFMDLLAARAGTGRVPGELAHGLWMSWEQIRELDAAGMTIGGHSLTHPVLARLTREEQAREIDRCAERLREELSAPMRYFSYPVGLDGTYDDTTRELLGRAGVRLAFAFAGGYVRGPVEDPLSVPRTGIALGVSRAWFAAMLTLPQIFARW